MSIFDKIDRSILRNIKIEHIFKRDPDPNKDSYEFGTPSKKGVIKVYGDFNDPEAFKIKVMNARMIQAWTMNEIQKDEMRK